jgi:hypothetical protein
MGSALHGPGANLMHKTPIQKYEEIMRMGRRLHEEHDWHSHAAQPTERRFPEQWTIKGLTDGMSTERRMRQIAASCDNDGSGKWDWLLWTAYISMCIGSTMLALWWFFSNLWR